MPAVSSTLLVSVKSVKRAYIPIVKNSKKIQLAIVRKKRQFIFDYNHRPHSVGASGLDQSS